MASKQSTCWVIEHPEIGFGDPLAYGNMLVWDDEGGMVFILPEANLIDETLERLLEQTPLV